MPFKTKAKTSEGDFELPPGGTYPAVWVGLINLGTQPREFNGKKWEEEKIYFLWELVGEHDSKGKPFIVSNDYTFSLHEKANLRKMVEGYYGKALGAEQELDLVLLIGKPCILSLSEGLSGKGQKYVEIVGVQRPMKGQTIGKPETEQFVWDFDLHEGTGDPQIPDWVPPIYGRKIVDEIKKSPEWADTVRTNLIPASKQPVTVQTADTTEEIPY